VRGPSGPRHRRSDQRRELRAQTGPRCRPVTRGSSNSCPRQKCRSVRSRLQAWRPVTTRCLALDRRIGVRPTEGIATFCPTGRAPRTPVLSTERPRCEVPSNTGQPSSNASETAGSTSPPERAGRSRMTPTSSTPSHAPENIAAGTNLRTSQDPPGTRSRTRESDVAVEVAVRQEQGFEHTLQKSEPRVLGREVADIVSELVKCRLPALIPRPRWPPGACSRPRKFGHRGSSCRGGSNGALRTAEPARARLVPGRGVGRRAANGRVRNSADRVVVDRCRLKLRSQPRPGVAESPVFALRLPGVSCSCSCPQEAPPTRESDTLDNGGCRPARRPGGGRRRFVLALTMDHSVELPPAEVPDRIVAALEPRVRRRGRPGV
jgi:hypothetical protein